LGESLVKRGKLSLHQEEREGSFCVGKIDSKLQRGDSSSLSNIRPGIESNRSVQRRKREVGNIGGSEKTPL